VQPTACPRACGEATKSRLLRLLRGYFDYFEATWTTSRLLGLVGPSRGCRSANTPLGRPRASTGGERRVRTLLRLGGTCTAMGGGAGLNEMCMFVSCVMCHVSCVMCAGLNEMCMCEKRPADESICVCIGWEGCQMYVCEKSLIKKTYVALFFAYTGLF